MTRINPSKHLLFNAIGLLVSIIPVTVSIFSYFPLWVSRRDASVLSGTSLLLICLALVPLYKHMKRNLRSPSAPLMWFCAFMLFFLLAKIADEMVIISFVGFSTNLIGAAFFKLARRYKNEEEKDEGRP